MSGIVPRSVRPDGSTASWVDTLGHDSLHDYDPLWARCVELGVVPAFHGIGYGWGSRVSPRNYVYNHLGNFAAAQEAACRSLVMGGVPHAPPASCASRSWRAASPGRHSSTPTCWATTRSATSDAVQMFDPARFDVEQAGELFAEFANGPLRGYADRVEEGARPLGDPGAALYGSRRLRRVGDHRPRGHRRHLHPPARLRLRSRRPAERAGVQRRRCSPTAPD